jgi:hypothetical protein
MAPSVLDGQLLYPELKAANKHDILHVLERAADDPRFIASIVDKGSVALRDYNLTWQERAALVAGDIRWIEAHIGKLTDRQCTLLDCMLQREAW